MSFKVESYQFSGFQIDLANSSLSKHGATPVCTSRSAALHLKTASSSSFFVSGHPNATVAGLIDSALICCSQPLCAALHVMPPSPAGRSRIAPIVITAMNMAAITPTTIQSIRIFPPLQLGKNMARTHFLRDRLDQRCRTMAIEAGVFSRPQQSHASHRAFDDGPIDCPSRNRSNRCPTCRGATDRLVCSCTRTTSSRRSGIARPRSRRSPPIRRRHLPAKVLARLPPS
jgi:hypothetical protein